MLQPVAGSDWTASAPSLPYLSNGSNAAQNVEKSILAAAPSLTKTQAWSSIYQITSYIKGGLDDATVNAMFNVARETLGEHKPAWTCVGVEDLVLGRYEMAVFAAIPPA